MTIIKDIITSKKKFENRLSMKEAMFRFVVIILISLSSTITFSSCSPTNAESGNMNGANEVFRDTSKPLEDRIQDLISRLTLNEKISQMQDESVAIPRLDIPEYNWWNESLHGVGRSGVATVFPQAIGLGATFDKNLILNVASAISDEARAMYNAARDQGFNNKYGGLTFWTPNVNIFRDPRWGRGQETYGEDPFLTSVIGTAFVNGLQGDNPDYLKVAACAKHYAVHSGPEKLRHVFDAKSTQKDLRETYLPAFKALVDADVEAVMCAYNRTNGELCCASEVLINDILLGEWNFQGHIVTDCGAVKDFYDGHNVVSTKAEAAAMAVKYKVGLNCGTSYAALMDAVSEGLVSEKEIDDALATLLSTRFKLGLFDDNSDNPYNAISEEVINGTANRKLAREAAVKSLVLLKNNGVLPLKNNLERYFVIGPAASDAYALMGNYYGVNPNMITILEGLAGGISTASQMEFKPGFLLDRPNVNPIDWTTGSAKGADATFVVMGLTGLLEGEEGESIGSPYFGDRLDYDLPDNQIKFLEKLRDNNDNKIVAIITGGSPMNLARVQELADAVLLVWYPGEEGGNAVADVIFGKESPSGKLPITFPKSLDQLPDYEDYSMKGRTYRYMEEEPLYPFGFGLTYSNFTYSPIKASSQVIKKDQTLTLTSTVQNTGKVASDEVVQLYLTTPDSDKNQPLMALKGFKRIRLQAGESKTVKFQLDPQALTVFDDIGKEKILTGDYEASIGGCSPQQRSLDLGSDVYQKVSFTIN